MFRFTQTIIRELSACASPKLQCWYRLHISILEVIGTVAAHFLQSCYACGSCTQYTIQLPDDGLCKPKHVGATIIILNGFNSLNIL